MRRQSCSFLIPLFFVSVAGAQAPARATEGAEQARIDVVNLLIANETADDFYAEGVAARDREQIPQALIAFLTAFRMEDSRYDAAFEIARLFAAWEEEELGYSWLLRAVDAGYWSEQRLMQDSLLAPFRSREGLSELVERVRQNYKSALPELRGLTEVRRPEGTPPAGGWPVLLCLHGYGMDQHDLTNLAEVGAAQGFFSISVCGYTPISPGRYAWPNEGPAIAAYIQDVLRGFEQDSSCNTKRVYTTGFSQGGLVATYLVSTHPELYSGAIPISPAGPLQVPALREGAVARPLYMLYGLAEGSRMQGNVTRFRTGFEQAGGRVQIETHPGGHSFPDNWSEVFTRALEFVRAEGR